MNEGGKDASDTVTRFERDARRRASKDGQGARTRFPASFIELSDNWPTLSGSQQTGPLQQETTMELMTRFALILFVRMVARAEQAMLLAQSARTELSAVRSMARNHVSRDTSR